MFLSFAFLVISLFNPVQSLASGDEMSDEDFKFFLQGSQDLVDKYGESAAKGCMAGAVKDGLKGGFAALCIGCATGAAAGVAVQMTFPSVPKREN